MKPRRPYYARKSRLDPYAGEIASWIEPVARTAYLAKGVAYAALSGLEALVLFYDGAGASGSGPDAGPIVGRLPLDEALASILLWLGAAALVVYVGWRVAQAFSDPEGRGTGAWAVGVRAACLISGALYGASAVALVHVALGASSADLVGAVGELDRLAGSRGAGWVAGLLMGALAVRGISEMYLGTKPYLPQEIRLAGLRGRPADRVLVLGRTALALRGGAMAILGGLLLVTSPASGPALERTAAWLLGVLVGDGATWLLAVLVVSGAVYAVYQLVKARYRLIGEY